MRNIAITNFRNEGAPDILFVDKPKEWSSFDIIRVLRKELGIKKMGHAGTLDPLATGLVILACGKATKRINEFMGMHKTYEVLIEFGKTSTSYDCDGVITDGELREVSRSEFEAMIPEFVGKIQQVPPIFSAIHVKGERAYDLARAGKEVVLEPRTVEVHEILILDWAWPFVTLMVACGKGTYIRSLAHDMGQRLGVGGYVRELRRTAIGPYRVEDAVKLG